MEKMQKISKLQTYLVIFCVSVGINLLTTVLKTQIPFQGVLTTILSLVSYVFLWMSFTQASKMQLKSKNKYLSLAIIITIVTIIIIGANMYLGVQLSAALLQAVGSDSTAIQALTSEDTLAIATKIMPHYATFGNVISAIQIIIEVVYLGIAAMIFMDNKKDIGDANTEHLESYE